MLEWLGTKIAGTAIGAILNPIVNGLLTAQRQKLEAEGSHEARVADLAQKQLSLDQREAEVKKRRNPTLLVLSNPIRRRNGDVRLGGLGAQEIARIEGVAPAARYFPIQSPVRAAFSSVARSSSGISP